MFVRRALCGHYVEFELTGVTVGPGVVVKERIKVLTESSWILHGTDRVDQVLAVISLELM